MSHDLLKRTYSGKSKISENLNHIHQFVLAKRKDGYVYIQIYVYMAMKFFHHYQIILAASVNEI